MVPQTARARAIDVVTAAMLILAVFLFARPGSSLSRWWAARRAIAESRRLAEEHWSLLSTIGSRLSQTPGAPQVVELSDYECPFCRRSSPVVDSAVASGIRVAYVHLPSPAHRSAKGAAVAALCADEQGRFSQMHGRLMNTTDWQKDGDWTREAQFAAIPDLSRFAVCMGSKSVELRLAQQRAMADSLKAMATPMFFSMKGVHRGVITLSELRDLAH